MSFNWDTFLSKKIAYYWEPPVNDGYGNLVWGDPIEIKCVFTFGSISGSELGDTPSIFDKSTTKLLIYDTKIVSDGRISISDNDLSSSSKILKTITSYILSDNTKTVTEAWLE